MSEATRSCTILPWRTLGNSVMTWDDLDAVHALLAELAPRWSAELNQSAVDEATIVVAPVAANDMIGPAFILFWAHGRVCLDQFRWDEYRKLGTFATLEQALAAMRSRLVPLVSPFQT